MNVHKNAPLTPKDREAMARSAVEGGLSQAGAADLFNTSPKTVAKWVKRFRAKGAAELWDRFLQTPFIAEPNPACHVQGRRSIASDSATLASRSQPRSRCHRTPSAASGLFRLEPDMGPGASQAGAPL
ncbi:helix-turn-helix domain-containing protein [Bradyrhizobium sp. 159]|uniref:helix-turn-helix domain-containing protein n=1 Tax=Bradyrhizobium sp. 159 TaxID=2782632 RepID=UPI001FF812CA|nr:helix-turn-helix domain-containing protein [Bradyrhizobium sp. 159]MCK1619081.1 helix-turn-helix domain-containing protein [Bradyrhizobium sp. 159]